jgi:leader peptidase (prepilin peptidase)/N-methyltransferase
MNRAEFIVAAAFAAFSLAIALSDIKTGGAPRAAFIAAFPVFIALNLLREGRHPLWASATGMLLGLLVFTLAYFVSKKKLGKADIWYSGLIGLVLGPLWWHPAVGMACLAGLSWAAASKKRRIPFIPCMALGSVAMSVVQGWFI